MTRLKWIALTTLALTLFSTIWFFFFRSGEDTPLYSVEFIETGYEDSFQLFPSVLTDSGHILFGLIKRSDASQTFKKGIIWSKNGIVEICPDCAAVSPTDMNENREVIGRFYPEGTEEESHPFFWTPEKGLVDLYQDLEVRLAIPGNLALVAINNHGRVLIQTHNETRPHYAGVQMSFSDQFSLGYIVDLISKPVVVESLPAGRMYVDLNDDNEVVGFNEEGVFLFGDGVERNLESPKEAKYNLMPRSINNQDDILFEATYFDRKDRSGSDKGPVMWSEKEGFREYRLPVLNEPPYVDQHQISIKFNDLGDLLTYEERNHVPLATKWFDKVGIKAAWFPKPIQKHLYEKSVNHLMIWKNESWNDINNCISYEMNWHFPLSWSFDINNKGWIVAMAFKDNRSLPVLLKPLHYPTNDER